MTRIISMHEYKLKESASSQLFEAAVDHAQRLDLFSLPGLVEHHLLRHIRGTRKVQFSAIWIYENRAAWEKLWGKADHPVEKENYPEQWKMWEDKILAPLLAHDPDRIDFAAYEEF